jgi:excisionase family DNA binding protein
MFQSSKMVCLEVLKRKSAEKSISLAIRRYIQAFGMTYAYCSVLYCTLIPQNEDWTFRKERQRVEEIITPSQLAALLQVNIRTVYRLAEKGAIPGNKIGRCWRFRKTDILDLVSNRHRKRSKDGESRSQ